MKTAAQCLLENWLLGCIVATVIFGATTVQTSFYYRRFKEDSLFTKITVGFLWVLQASQILCMTYSLYWYLIVHYQSPGSWYPLGIEIVCLEISGLIASAVVQLSFARRIYFLSQSYALSLAVAFLVAVQFAFGAAYAVIEYMGTHSPVHTGAPWTIVTWISTNVITDMFISVTMYFLLVRRHTGVKRTDTVVNRMVLYSIYTGVVTSILGISIAAVLSQDKNSFAMILCVSYAGLYTFVLLSNLHARSKLATFNSAGHDPLCTFTINAHEAIVSITKNARQESWHDGPAEIGLHSRLEKLYPETTESCTYPTTAKRWSDCIRGRTDIVDSLEIVEELRTSDRSVQV